MNHVSHKTPDLSPLRARVPKTGGPRSAAFTLTELLTVIAIAGILAAIVIPVVGNMRSSADSARCSSSLRQLQLANIAYAGTSRDRSYVPVFVNGAEVAAAGRVLWTGNAEFVSLLSIGKTISSITDLKQAWPRQLICPRATIDGGRIDRSYAYNRTGITALYSKPGAKAAVKVSEVPRPGRVIAFIDAVNWMMDYDVALGTYTEEVTQDNTVALRHSNAANAVFFDGHVERLGRDRLATDATLWRITE